MFVSKVFSRIPRSSLKQCRALISSHQELTSHFSNHFHSLREPTKKCIPFKATEQHHLAGRTRSSQQLRFSSSVSPQPSDTNNAESAFSEGAADLSFEDLVKIVTEKEEMLKTAHQEIKEMKDKVLRSYAEVENIINRTNREAENSKRYAIQNFAKSLLDVADNLGRASSVVKESFSKIDPSKDTTEAVPLLKTLLEGVDMTEKQLSEVFKKFGVEKYHPLNEPFDPNRHNALFQVPDASKTPGTIAVVMKSGYQLYDRVIRPAEVGVAQAMDN